MNGYSGSMICDDVLTRLTDSRDHLKAMGVRQLFLFGSVAQGTAGAGSDVDVMVDLDEGPGGRKPIFTAFDVGGIRHALSVLLERPVDLVVRSDALRANSKLRQAARDSLVHVF